MEPGKKCTICDKLLVSDDDEPVTIVHERGLKTLITVSKKLKDNYWTLWEGKESVQFHVKCRKRYSVKKCPNSPQKISHPASVPSSSNAPTTMDISEQIAEDPFFIFDPIEQCILCGCALDALHKAVHVMQQQTKKEIIYLVRQKKDKSSQEIQRRLKFMELSSDPMKYHHKCYYKIRRDSSGNTCGRPFIEDLDMAMEAVYNLIENSEDPYFILSDLHEVMDNYKPANATLFKKLREKYGNDIEICQHVGKTPVISYKLNCVAKMCDGLSNAGIMERKKILDTAASIIRSDIRAEECEITSFPPSEKFLENTTNNIPESLMNFLQKIITTGKRGSNRNKWIVKCEAIAHAIVNAVRPNSFLSNVLFAASTYIYRKSGSRLILDMLSKLGFGVSYAAIQSYEESAIINLPKVRVDDEVLIQFVYDNTDHNAQTIDGHRTFHCLGGISVYTPNYGVSADDRIPKCIGKQSAAALASKNTVPIVPYGCFKVNGLKNIKYVDVKTLRLGEPKALPFTYSTYLWAKCFNIKKIPSWRGFMEVLSIESSYYVSHITCLPFINQPPSDLSTINSALQYSAAECKKLNQKTCFVTFDQPLYIKARSIVAALQGQADNSLENVVVRLGGFHLLMSFLGAIGYLMAGSGLDDLWSVVYAPESVKKMIVGHAFSRSLRAHVLTFTGLGTIIGRMISSEKQEKYHRFLLRFLGKWDEEPPQLSDCNIESDIQEMTAEFVDKLNALRNNGPTAELWIQYFECVVIVLQFIEAERLGNWVLHLQCVEKMLPFFHATGHIAYAKSAQIYLQDMANLELTMDEDEYESFAKKGFFTIRRSDKSWAGIWSDMTIEQTLNRFFGTDLKHGRGVTPGVVARYLDTMPCVFGIMKALENYCEIDSVSSEQHVDLSNCRMEKDADHLSKFIYWLDKHTPFEKRAYLMSLATGVIGGPEINCHKAMEKGLMGMTTMVDKTADSVSLSFANKVKSLAYVKNGANLLDDNFVFVNSSVLFQRLYVISQGDESVKRDAFQYELSPYPLSLFDEHGFLRKTTKSELYRTFIAEEHSDSLSTFTFVLDGGFLLHKVVWPHGKTYREIFGIYLTYITKNFNGNCSVVFDGYNDECMGVKSYERYRRREKNVAADIDFTADMPAAISQREFLKNVQNKQKFVELLARYLRQSGVNVAVAPEDADATIVRTAIRMQQLNPAIKVAIVGNDVDLLVLLTALTPGVFNIYYYKVMPGNKSNVFYSSQTNQHLKDTILFIHAFAGCDTTSSLFGKGKKSIVTLLSRKPELAAYVQTFYNQYSSEDMIFEAAEKIVVHLYSPTDPSKTLGELRYSLFESSVLNTATPVKMAQLPPTKSALNQHAKRVYYQIQLWLGNTIQPESWGWTRTPRMMLPIFNTSAPAPENLIAMVFCGCSKMKCRTSACKCRKAGLKCGKFCKNCVAEVCENAAVDEITVENRPEVSDSDETGDEDEEYENFVKRTEGTNRPYYRNYQIYGSSESDNSDV